jgi:DNA-binding XRE family transcriptional regulator
LSSIELNLANRLETDERFRDRYIQAWASNEVATELRAMRKRRTWKQADLAAAAATGQSAISRIEKQDYDGWTYKTLLTMAMRLRARLRIRLEPIEDVVRAMRAHERSDADTASTSGEFEAGAGATGSDVVLRRGGNTETGVPRDTANTGWAM